MEVKVTVFAALKDHYQPEFPVELNTGSTIGDCLNKLLVMQESASGLLKRTRTAIGKSFVGQNYELKDGDNVILIPPSSGG